MMTAMTINNNFIHPNYKELMAGNSYLNISILGKLIWSCLNLIITAFFDLLKNEIWNREELNQN